MISKTFKCDKVQGGTHTTVAVSFTVTLLNKTLNKEEHNVSNKCLTYIQKTKELLDFKVQKVQVVYRGF